MNSFSNRCLLVFVFCLSTTAYATGPRVSPSLISSTSDIYTINLPPIIDSDVKHNSYLGDVVSTVLKEEKIDAVVSVLPLQNMVKYYLLKDNALAVLSPYLNLTASQKKDLIIIPIDSVKESYIYYKPAHPDGLAWKGNLKNLQDLRYGAVKGEPVKKYQQAGIEVKKTRIESLLKKLVAREVDFIRLPDLTADWFIEQQFADEKQSLVKMEVAAGEMQLAIIFNQKHAEGPVTAKKFKHGLNELIKKGQLKKIKQQFIKQN